MKDRLMNDKVITGTNKPYNKNTNYSKPYQEKPYGNYERNNNENQKLASGTGDFIKMVETSISEVQQLTKVKIHYSKLTAKEENGIVMVKMHGERAFEEKPEIEPGILFYYIEDPAPGNSKNNYVPKSFSRMVMIINQKTGAVLFSKISARAIEQAERYVKRIIEKEVSYSESTYKKSENSDSQEIKE